VEDRNAEAARLIALYRGRREDRLAPHAPDRNLLTRIGAVASAVPTAVNGALDFAGRFAVAIPKAAATPRSVDWQSLPRLLQEIGADGLVVTGAANFLVGLIIGLLGISQLARFGAIAYVPELVVVAQFRELGPLVTAIVVAGRSGAGLASELATMKVSEEIDALRSMGFDPLRWLVVPRCVALVIVVPVLTWIGNALALLGGFLATTATTEMPARAYLLATTDAITAGHLLGGLVKAPFLALAIGLIACRQGLAAQGGAAAVGAKTTNAVVMAILGVIVTNALFTFIYTLMGV
jgi:phospholipid/cholesterol/gamma-HCH transport system permease protein